MSPNMFSVRMTPLSFRGLEIMIMAAESTSWCSSLRSGNSLAMSSVTVFRQSRDVARTLALSIDVTGRGGLAALAIWQATRVIRSTSGIE